MGQNHSRANATKINKIETDFNPKWIVIESDYEFIRNNNLSQKKDIVKKNIVTDKIVIVKI
jgi:hypothetical protein